MAKKKEKQEEGDTAARKEASAVSTWLSRIEVSKRYRKKTAEKYKWRQLIEEYRGYFAGLQDAADIYIPSLNLIFAYVKSEIPSLYLRDPKIKVNPKKGATVLASKILEKALNYLWRSKRIKRENKKNVLDALLVGHSWFKTGYNGKFGTIEDGNGNTFEFIESEDFFGYRVPYENIAFNPDANDPPYDCTWIAHEVWMPLEDVQNNKSFQNTEKLEASSGGEYERTDVQREDANDRKPDVPMVKLYEVWDKKSMTVFTVTDGCTKYIRAPRPWPYKMKGFPFSFLRLNEDPMCPYGIPDCYMFEPQVLELMKIRASELDHLKRFNRQLLMAEGHMSDDAKDQFTQGITGAVIPVRTDGRPISEIVAPIPYPQIQTDIYAIEERLNQDIINISGQSPTERGAAQKTTTRTVRELIQIKKGAENRRSDKIDTIEDFVEDAAGNLVALLQQLADVPYFVRVTGEDPEKIVEGLNTRPSAALPGAITNEEGFTFTKEDIQGEFDFEVVAGSTAPLDQEQKMSMLMSLVELLPQTGVMPGGPVYTFLGQEFADELDMPGLKKAIEEEHQVAAQRAQQMEAQMQEQKQMQVASDAANLQIKAEREATKQNQVMVQAMQAFKQEEKEEKDDE